MAVTLLPGGGLATALAFVCLVAAPAAHAAEDFPNKTIEVVIHTKYGGGTDTTARMMMIRSRRNLDTDMAVVSKRGGSGAKAHAYVLSRPADGHTLLALTQTHLYTIARGRSKLTIDDIVGVARAMDDPTFITVRADSPYKTIEELIAASKEKALNWGVATIASTEHIGLARFASAAGIQYKVVPLGSGAQMVQQLMSGAVDATLPNVSEAIAQLADGSVRALVVMSDKRLKTYPDIPTTFEKGINVKTSTTRGYGVLKGTPQPIIEKLSQALTAAMRHETFVNYLKSSGLAPDDSVAGTEVWDRQLKEEFANASRALRDLGVIK
jgi:putative tricarboxylic transport membrane protein